MRVRSIAPALALCLSAGRAVAQNAPLDCAEETPSVTLAPLEVTPAAGGQGVTLDAPLIVRYSHGYFGPEGSGDDPERLVELGLCPLSDTGNAVRCDVEDADPRAGGVTVFGDTLVFTPSAQLESNRWYAARATGVDGFIEFPFRTGSLRDREPPRVGGLRRAEAEGADPSCPWVPTGGRRIGFVFAPATDDGPVGSIEYLLYLTRGARTGAPELRDRLRITADEVQLPLLLTLEESHDPICVRIVAIDGVGRISENAEEHCVDPLTGTAFQPLCAVNAPGARASLAALAWALAAAAVWMVRTRRRSSSRRTSRT